MTPVYAFLALAFGSYFSEAIWQLKKSKKRAVHSSETSSITQGSHRLQTKASEHLTSPAESFRSPLCSDAITRSRAEYSGLWQKMVINQKADSYGEVYTQKSLGLMYVLNYKTGTESMLAAMGSLGGENEYYSVPRSGATLDAQSEKQEENTNWFLFTVVREPLDCAWSAYKEVSHRGIHLSMGCGSGDDRYLEYLKLLKEGTMRHRDAYHSFPQATKVDVLNALGRDSFDFIVRYEKFEEDMRVLFKQLEHPPDENDIQNFFNAYNLSNKENPHQRNSKDKSCDTTIEETSSEHGMNPTTCEVACEVYDIDYTCFGYERPSCCSA